MMSVPMYGSQSIVFRVLLTLQAVYSWKFSFKDNIDWNGDVTVVDLSGQGITEIDGNSIGRLSEEQRQRVRVLKLNDNELTSLPDTIGLLDNLEELCLNNNNLKSMSSAIGSLKSLKKLDLGQNRLTEMPNPPNIRELRIRVYEHLGPDAAKAFRQCKGLEKLHLDGYRRTSSFVSALMPNLPNIRELRIEAEELSTDAAAAFGQCKRLEKLHLDGYEQGFIRHGYRQTSSFVSALMPNLPNIRELKICVDELSPDAAEAFRQCKELEKLCLIGYSQTSSFVSALMSNLPNIRELEIEAEVLSTDTAMAFGQCKGLEKLYFDMYGYVQSSSFVSALMPNLTSIRELGIKVDMLSTDTAMAFRQCKQLEKLHLYGYVQSSAFVSALIPGLTSIRELMICVEGLSKDAVAAFKQCKQLEKLILDGWQISPFVSALMPGLTNIRELEIRVKELSPDDAEAFKQCERLEKLCLDGFLEPGCIECILSSPHMESLRYLGVDRVMGGPSSGDKKAIDEALKRHVVVILDE